MRGARPALAAGLVPGLGVAPPVPGDGGGVLAVGDPVGAVGGSGLTVDPAEGAEGAVVFDAAVTPP